MNMTQIAGHLGSDPETRFTANGQKVTSFRVATNGRKGGKDITIWWRVTVWGDRFDKMMPYIKKGSGVIVFGELQKPEIYTDKEGQQQVSLELTAETIKFNPFGRADSNKTEHAGVQQAAPHGNAHTGYGNAGFGGDEHSFGSFGSNGSIGSGSTPQQGGYNSFTSGGFMPNPTTQQGQGQSTSQYAPLQNGEPPF